MVTRMMLPRSLQNGMRDMSSPWVAKRQKRLIGTRNVLESCREMPRRRSRSPRSTGLREAAISTVNAMMVPSTKLAKSPAIGVQKG